MVSPASGRGTRVDPGSAPGPPRPGHHPRVCRRKDSCVFPSQTHAQAPARRLRRQPLPPEPPQGTGRPAGDRAGSPDAAINHLASPRRARADPGPGPGLEAPLPASLRPSAPRAPPPRSLQRRRGPGAGPRQCGRPEARPPQAPAHRAGFPCGRRGGRRPAGREREREPGRRVRAEAPPERGSGRSSPRGWKPVGPRAGAPGARQERGLCAGGGRAEGERDPALVPEVPGRRPARWKTRGSCPNLGGTGGSAQSFSWTRELCPRPGGHAARPRALGEQTFLNVGLRWQRRAAETRRGARGREPCPRGGRGPGSV